MSASSEAPLLRWAIHAAAPASNTLLVMMMGSAATGGMPNSAELTSGDNTAVNKPTLKPNL